MTPNSSNNPVKSKFRGVYKCGKRWKAQLQCQGIQFYLGTFDTEGEAAKAYDRKARDEKGVKGLTNFDENGDEAVSTAGSGYGLEAQDTMPQYSIGEDASQSSPPSCKAKRPKLSSSSSSSIGPSCLPTVVSESVVPGVLVNINNNSVQVRMMWERLCQITQRILLAKAAHEKLFELQKSCPDKHKEGLLSCLGDEISLLTQVKQQVEEAIARSVSQGLTASFSSSSDSTSSSSSVSGPGFGGMGAISYPLHDTDRRGRGPNLVRSLSPSEVSNDRYDTGAVMKEEQERGRELTQPQIQTQEQEYRQDMKQEEEDDDEEEEDEEEVEEEERQEQEQQQGEGQSDEIEGISRACHQEDEDQKDEVEMPVLANQEPESERESSAAAEGGLECAPPC